jgi:hypothetical protein
LQGLIFRKKYGGKFAKKIKDRIMFAPNAIIENLLQQKKAQAAMVLDALFSTDAITLKSIEISSILHYFKLCEIPMGESVLRKGLFDLARLGLFETFKVLSRSKGRPLWNYAPKTIEKMARILGVKIHRDENCDSIPKKAYKSVKAFRAGKHYSLIARLGISRLSRRKLGARLGVGGRSTFNYEIETNIEVTQRIETTKMSFADIAAAPEKRLNQNVYLVVEIERDMTEDELRIVYKDFDESYLLVGNRKTKDRKKLPYTQFFLRRELEAGHEVYRAKQITNEYRINAA